MVQPYHRWLVAWCWALIAIGIVFVIGVFAPFRAPTLLFLDLVFWPLDGRLAGPLAPEAIFSSALVGAVTFGWGLLMLGLVRDPVLSQSATVWRAMTIALASWFIVDSLASWVSGAHLNVLGNIGIAASFLIPVLKSGVLSARGTTARATRP
jgi:hypothetical protein